MVIAWKQRFAWKWLEHLSQASWRLIAVLLHTREYGVRRPCSVFHRYDWASQRANKLKSVTLWIARLAALTLFRDVSCVSYAFIRVRRVVRTPQMEALSQSASGSFSVRTQCFLAKPALFVLSRCRTPRYSSVVLCKALDCDAKDLVFFTRHVKDATLP